MSHNQNDNDTSLLMLFVYFILMAFMLLLFADCCYANDGVTAPDGTYVSDTISAWPEDTPSMETISSTESRDSIAVVDGMITPPATAMQESMVSTYLSINFFNGLLGMAFLLIGFIAFDFITTITIKWDFKDVFEKNYISNAGIVILGYMLALALIISRTAG